MRLLSLKHVLIVMAALWLLQNTMVVVGEPLSYKMVKKGRVRAIELRKALSFFQMHFSDGFRVVPFRKPPGGSLLS